MKPFSLGLVLGSLGPTLAVFYFGGSPAACFVAGMIVALLPVACFPRHAARVLNWMADLFAPRRRKGVMRTERRSRVPLPRLGMRAVSQPVPKSASVTAEADADLVSALRNLGCPPQKAHRIARQTPPGAFDDRLRMAIKAAA